MTNVALSKHDLNIYPDSTTEQMAQHLRRWAQENHKRYVEEIAKGEERQRDWDEFYTIVCDEIARLEALPSIPEGGG